MKHYHSYNGVFKSEMFTDSCKEDGQTQNFSGVGAQHQNAEVGRVIQTVVYIARYITILGPLNLKKDGLDNMVLWVICSR